ncbi:MULTISPECIES: AsmA-like C-terminal region-containing protein [unclassified Desulfovibrio]|uniref:AsmA-like C-terminal region-containing protein n=1 Tax=unclassified Desulfovibrio TaxID=2593640 RepID=UPI0013EB6F25|nr:MULTISPECIES: AsmA-like C-terminal region-containing protein [unclassified Desulfovibrio]
MKRVLLCILGVLVLGVVGAAFYVTHMDAGFIVRRIAEATEKATGAPLELKETPHISLLPPGLRFGAARWSGVLDGNAVAVSLAGGMARLELEPLLSGALVVSELRLDRPEADIRLAAAAAGDAESGPAQAPGASDTRGRKAPDDALPFELGRLTVSQGALHLEDGARDIRVSGFNLALENLRRREEAGIQGDMVLLLRERAREAGARQSGEEAGEQATPLLEGNLAFKGELRYYAPNLTFRQVSVAFTPLRGMVPRELAPLQLTCEGALDLAALRLGLAEARLTAPQGRLELKGEGWLAPPAFKGDVTFAGSAAKLAALAGAKLPVGAGGAGDALELRAALDWSGKKGVVDARLQLGEAGNAAPQALLTFKGNANLEPLAVAGDVAITGSARRMAALGGLALPKGAPDTLDVRTRVAYATPALRLGGLDARAAGLTLAGDLTVDLPTAAQAPLSLGGKLRVGAVALDPWLTAEKGSPAVENRAPVGQSPAKGAPKTGSASSASALPALDLGLAVAELRYGGFGLRDMAARITGQSGRYTLGDFSASIRSGGALKGTATADLPASAYSVNASGAGIDIGALCAAAGKAGLASGSAGFTARLRAAGAGAPALLASLTGEGKLEARDLSAPALREAAEKLRALPMLKGGIPDRVTMVSAPFTASRGEITAKPVTATAQGISLRGEARASLPREYLEGSATVSAAGLNIPLTFKGPFDAVAVSVDPKFALDAGKTVIPRLLNNQRGTPPAGQTRGGSVRDDLGRAGELLRGVFGK